MNELEQIESLESMGSIPGALAAIACLVLVAWGAGRLLKYCLRDRRPFDFIWEIIYGVAGLNLVALGAVSLGSLGLLVGDRPLWLLATVGILAVTAILVRVRIELLARRPVRSYLPRLRAIYFLTVPLVLLTLGPALCYPAGWDELVYHGVLPKRWYADGWPAYYADIPYSGFPSLVELLCWLVAPIESLVASRLLVWLAWIVGLWLLHDVLNRSSKDRSTSILTLSFAVCPTSLMISANCYVEALLFLQLAAIFSMLNLQATEYETNTHKFVLPVLLGVLVGGASAIKLTSVIFMCIPLVWFASLARRFAVEKNSLARRSAVAKNNGGRSLSTTPYLLSLAISALFALPFYLRPWILAGNPLCPYFASWFSADPNLIESSQYHHAIGAAFGMQGISAFLATPFLIACDASLYDGSFGWQFIALLGLAVVGLAVKQSASERMQSTRVLILALIFYAFWFFSSQQARFALPAVCMVTLLAGRGLLALDSLKRKLATAILAIASIVSLPWINAAYYFASWETIFGIWNQTEYLLDSTGNQYVSLLNAIGEKTPSQANILLVFEHRSLFIPRPCTVGTPFFQARGLMPPESFEDSEHLMTYLRENRFTHVAFGLQPIGPDQAGAWWERVAPVFTGIEACVQSGKLRVEWASEQYLLLTVMESTQVGTALGIEPNRLR